MQGRGWTGVYVFLMVIVIVKQHVQGSAVTSSRPSLLAQGSHSAKSDGAVSESGLREEEWRSVVPKTRLSGGLAEMGGLDRENTLGWPIYWR